MEATNIVLFSCLVVICAGYSAPQQPQCNQNEVLSCVHDCPPERTCRNRLIQFRCAEPTKKCEYKCVCKPGLYRNSIGECISGKECDQCGAPNEFYSCGQECDTECSNLATQNRTNCPFINIVCNRKCYCDDGYARNEKKQCVPIEKCPKTPCGKNEELKNCPSACAPISCPKSYKEEQEKLANCVETLQCRPSACRCRPNYRRDENGTCIYIGKCPGICPTNEVFSNCTQALCRAQNCTQSGQAIACPAVAEGSCTSGCVCKEGTLRDKNGNCVPKKQCKAPCGKNEESKNCPSACAPIICPKSYKEEQEKLANCVETLQCRPSAYRCRPNYRRDENGACIYIGKYRKFLF